MEEFEQYLYKADDDLDCAKLLVLQNKRSVPVYLAQQCAEKSLKAYLTFREQPLAKTHDLRRLVELAKQLDPSFEEIFINALEINGLDTAFRYPEDVLEPEEQDVINTLVYAEEIFNFVKMKCV
jgi:HEPN domain-containing protein